MTELRNPTIADLSAALLRAANDAQSLLKPQGKAEAEVIRDERQMFAAAIRGWISESGIDVEPLGYRPVLTAEESSNWRQRLQQRWGLQGLSWHPILAAPALDEVLVLPEAYMWEKQGAARERSRLGTIGRRASTIFVTLGSARSAQKRMLRYDRIPAVHAEATRGRMPPSAEHGLVSSPDLVTGWTLRTVVRRAWPRRGR